MCSITSSGSIYELFSVENSDDISVFKERMKEALMDYTFFDPAAEINAQDGSIGTFHLIKLIGRDYKQELDVESFSPYRMEGSCPFKITALAAKILCQILQEDEKVDALMLLSLSFNKYTVLPLEPHDSFGDEVACILAQELPRARFKLLRIGGAFGDEGIHALVDELPSLVANVIDPRDLLMSGTAVSEEAIEKVEERFAEFIAKKREQEPRSLVLRQKPFYS